MWILDKLTGYDQANADRAAATDAYTVQWQQRQFETGRWTQAQYDRALTNTANANADATPAAIETAFADSVKENAAAMSEGVNGALSFSVGKIFGAIPLSVWALGAVALFFYLGGGAMLRGRLAKL